MSETLLQIWFMHVAAMLSPGPNTLLVSRFAAEQKRELAQYAALGITLGAAVWVTSTMLGVHLLFEAFPVLRLGFQGVGGVYLIYIAWRLWGSDRPSVSSPSTALAPASAFRIGLLTNLTNPKSALFFCSVFAAALPAAPGLALQLSTLLMIVFNVFCWHLFLAFAFSLTPVQTGYGRARASINRVTSVLLGAFGGWMLFILLVGVTE